MSIELMNLVWNDAGTKGAARLVLLALADQANDTGTCWPSLATIARRVNVSRSMVARILTKLEEKGYVTRQRRGKGYGADTTIYLVNRGSLVNRSSPLVVNRSSPKVVNRSSLKPPLNHQSNHQGAGWLFTLYESTFGPITKDISEALKLAVVEYPEAEIRNAINISVDNGKRRWQYTAAILRRRKNAGYPTDERQQPPANQPSRPAPEIIKDEIS